MKHTLLFSFLFCLLSHSVFAQSNPCLQGASFRIVILGSSTAAGAGVSRGDSAWVNRYRRHLQSINPNNEVINLAVGGFVTYRIMPSFFVPGIQGRPLPDTAHNITKALSYNPDAIIVNLPSNDRQFPMQEQLDNFDSLFHYSNNNQIPMWICTTQPVNSPSFVAYQMAVRDSILARYDSFAIDFWTGIADPATGMIDSIYNADGTHLNDQGHRLLEQKVFDKDILSTLLSSPAFPDLAVSHMLFDENDVCGDSASKISLVITNFGQVAAKSPVYLSYEELNSGQQGLELDSIMAGMGNCESDTLTFEVPTFDGGDFQFVGYVSPDSLSQNDSLMMNRSYSGHPLLSIQEDTICQGNSALLQAMADPTDSIYWYDTPQGGNRVGSGMLFPLNNVQHDTLLYAEAIRGKLFYENSLGTITQSNINWNGTMFDLVGKDSIVLDSFSLKAIDSGTQVVEVYYKSGSHLGFEQNSAAWQLLGQATIQVPVAESFVEVPIGGLSIPAGDTVGVYIQMQNSGNRLGYLSNGTTMAFHSPELSILLGSGVAHNFGANYYPRQWNGRVHYHYGYKPNGDCQSPRVPVGAYIAAPPALDLGEDTIGCEQVILIAGAGSEARYTWSTGDTSSSLQVDSSGVYWVEKSNLCGREIDAVYVEIEDAALADFILSQNGLVIQLTDLSQGARAITWDMGDGSMYNLQHPNHTYAQAGTYTILQIVSNSCGADTMQQEIQIGTTALGGEALSAKFLLYPNPSPGKVFLQGPDLARDLKELAVFDLVGKKIQQTTFRTLADDQVEILVADAAEGMYLLRAVHKGIQYSWPFILKR